MRRFQVKDLMIQALPQQGPLAAPCSPITDPGYCPRGSCYWDTGCLFGSCTWPTPFGCHRRCTFLTSFTMACAEYQVEDLQILKKQLAQLLAEVERQEKILSETEKPQSLEEAEALEQKLTEALVEVKARKEVIQKRANE